MEDANKFYSAQARGADLVTVATERIRATAAEEGSEDFPQTSLEDAARELLRFQAQHATSYDMGEKVLDTEFFTARLVVIDWKDEAIQKAANERFALIETLSRVLATAEAQEATEKNTARSWKVLASQARDALENGSISQMRDMAPKLAARLERKLGN